MPFAEIDGGRIHYRIDGPQEAPVLVLSHSLGTDLSLWDHQAKSFSGFRILRYDSRGHGRSSVTAGPCSIDRLGRDVLELLNRLELRRVYFCGLSLGGMVGMWLAMHESERLEKLVLANTAALLGPRDAWEKRIAAILQGGMQAVAGGVIERWLSPAFRETHPDEVAAVRAMLLAAPAVGYCAGCAAIRDMDLRDGLASVRTPTLVIAGTRDAATPPALGRAIADAIPGARYAELPAAHLSNIEASEAFGAAVLEFLNA